MAVVVTGPWCPEGLASLSGLVQAPWHFLLVLGSPCNASLSTGLAQ